VAAVGEGDVTPRRRRPRDPHAQARRGTAAAAKLKRFEIRVAGTSEVIGELRSGEAAHRIAHMFIDAWPERSPLAVRDRDRRQTRLVALDRCGFAGCRIPAGARGAVRRREPAELIAQDRARHVREVVEPALRRAGSSSQTATSPRRWPSPGWTG
jgi:hypothetical protein